MSDDGRFGITLIAFVGSVFSPYYGLARRRGRTDPHDHCALNAVLYGVRGPAWSCTERGRGSLVRETDTLAIGLSALRWTGEALEVRVEEVTAPFPARLRGRVRVVPVTQPGSAYDLDEAGRHRWWPIAPSARIEVVFEQPSLAWSGHGYLDTNEGDEPLADGFLDWHWSRARLREGAAIVYDVTRRDGSNAALALRGDAAGMLEELEPPPVACLPRTIFGLDRRTRADAGSHPAVVRTLEDGPFYARSLLSTRLFGEPATAVHESLSGLRLGKPWVQAMLPFRMPRSPW